MERLKAFTLAEVLITLAIIGVVSALTIPTVITNHRKTTYITQLKKNYSSITKGFKTAMAREGVYQVDHTQMWSKLPSWLGEGAANVYFGNYWDDDKAEFKNEFEKIFNVTGKGDEIQYKYLNGNNALKRQNAIVLADGSYLYIWFFKNSNTNITSINKGNTTKRVASIYFDVNGAKAPNQWGRDLFYFHLGNDGNLYPNNSLEDPNECEINKNGMTCATRVMKKGWKMDY